MSEGLSGVMDSGSTAPRNFQNVVRQSFGSTITITTPTTAKHAGMAVAFTPQSRGRVQAMVYGRAKSLTVATNVTVDLRYGTGTAPTLNQAVTGSVAGIAQVLQEAITALTVCHQFMICDIIPSLTIGTAYWFDLTALCAAGNATFDSCYVALAEV